jgi:hypothetical protein
MEYSEEIVTSEREAEVKIDLKALTTCGVQPDGEMLEIGFIDAAGEPTSIRVPFESAQAIAMTLPRLLSEAVRRITGEAQSRYVFPLGTWRIESADHGGCAIATFSTADGFEVSFGISPETCRSLGWALRSEGEGGGVTEDGARDVTMTLN